MRSKHIRFLEEAAKLGQLTVLLWNDNLLLETIGNEPKFTETEREYFLRAIRFVTDVKRIRGSDELKSVERVTGFKPDVWVVGLDANAMEGECAISQDIKLREISESDLRGFPVHQPSPVAPGTKQVVVTGCYDWLHSGHVRFFEEVSGYGELHVVVGNDANVRMLKGPRNPMHSEDERRYVVGAMRFVKQAWVSSGQGWLDAEPEIARIKPDIYAVNEDGDKGGKREFCEQRGIEYLVLKRTPAPGLPKRSSTELRGY